MKKTLVAAIILAGCAGMAGRDDAETTARALALMKAGFSVALAGRKSLAQATVPVALIRVSKNSRCPSRAAWS